MGYFTASNTKVLNDGPNTITIRKLSVIEKQQAETSAMVFPAYAMDDKGKMAPLGEITMDLTRRIAMYLTCGIVSWDGPDFMDDAGQPVPCTDENKTKLPGGLGDWVAEQIIDFSGLSGHEKKA